MLQGIHICENDYHQYQPLNEINHNKGIYVGKTYMDIMHLSVTQTKDINGMYIKSTYSWYISNNSIN
jgi:hypothetical protein